MLGLTVELHPAAIDEANGAFLWYAERSPDAANTFIAELDKAILAVSESPERWPEYVAGTRRYLFRNSSLSFQAISILPGVHTRIWNGKSACRSSCQAQARLLEGSPIDRLNLTSACSCQRRGTALPSWIFDYCAAAADAQDVRRTCSP